MRKRLIKLSLQDNQWTERELAAATRSSTLKGKVQRSWVTERGGRLIDQGESWQSGRMDYSYREIGQCTKVKRNALLLKEKFKRGRDWKEKALQLFNRKERVRKLGAYLGESEEQGNESYQLPLLACSKAGRLWDGAASTRGTVKGRHLDRQQHRNRSFSF